MENARKIIVLLEFLQTQQYYQSEHKDFDALAVFSFLPIYLAG